MTMIIHDIWRMLNLYHVFCFVQDLMFLIIIHVNSYIFGKTRLGTCKDSAKCNRDKENIELLAVRMMASKYNKYSSDIDIDSDIIV